MGNGVVMVCGSRSLSASAVPLVNQVVQSLLSAGRGIAVGCAAGADATVVSSVLAAGAGSQLQVFAAFGPGGAGSAGSVSAVSVVSQAAANGRARFLVGWRAGISAFARASGLTLTGLCAFSGWHRQWGRVGGLCFCLAISVMGFGCISFLRFRFLVIGCCSRQTWPARGGVPGWCAGGCSVCSITPAAFGWRRVMGVCRCWCLVRGMAVAVIRHSFLAL